jgi:hypothetical protein
MRPSLGTVLRRVRLHLSSTAAVDDSQSVDRVGAQDSQRIHAGLAVAGAPQRQRAGHVGVVPYMPTRAPPCSVLGPGEKEGAPVPDAPLLNPARCGAVVAVVPAQVDSGGSPQRTAFPGDSSRKWRAAW